MSYSLADAVLKKLYELGVKDIVVCPGGRNAHLVELMVKPEYGFKVSFHFEERSASYLALGICKRSLRPVAVVTTSGTACGELLPACMEAHYSDVNLLFVTCDRPKRFRGTGAPQACEQVGLFGSYAFALGDVDEQSQLENLHSELRNEQGFTWPCHLNVCFEDPMRELTAPVEGDSLIQLDNTLPISMKDPLVLVGELDKSDAKIVKAWLIENQLCCVAEPLSQLRESPDLGRLNLKFRSDLARLFNEESGTFDSIIRIGGIPVSSIWRDLESKLIEVPVVSISHLPYSGLARPSSFIRTDNFLEALNKLDFACSRNIRFKFENDQLQRDLQTLIFAERSSEQSFIFSLSKNLPKNAFVYLGNSLSIRDWDLCSVFDENQRLYAGNRGLNGIDGQVSTFFGMCVSDRPNYALVGDLTFLYDVAALWIRTKDRRNIDFTIYIMSNGGGMIFNSMFDCDDQLNRHETQFEPIAKAFGLQYVLIKDPSELIYPQKGQWIIELSPNEQATSAIRSAIKNLK